MKSLSLVSPDVRINKSGGGDGYVYRQLSIISTDKSFSSKSLFLIPWDILWNAFVSSSWPKTKIIIIVHVLNYNINYL